MRIKGFFTGASRDLQGNLIISFAVDDNSMTIKEFEEIKDNELDLEIDKHREKRSLNANAYFWKLCDQIAKKIESDKDSIYKLQLSRYGVFVDCQIWTQAVEEFKRQFRYVEEFDDGYGETQLIRCYLGSSKYNTKEMSDLINGTVNDAQDLGIETWNQDEIDSLIKEWKGEK